jgi:hypothetical protein
MKFFIRGFCDKSCPRVNKLNKEDEKNLTNSFYIPVKALPSWIFNMGQNKLSFDTSVQATQPPKIETIKRCSVEAPY